jgi:hypothetical protein
MAIVAGGNWGGTTTRTETASRSSPQPFSNFGIADLQSLERLLPYLAML